MSEEQEKPEIKFTVADNKWIIRLNEEGIFFNHEVFPELVGDAFVKAFINIMELNYAIKFVRKDEGQGNV